MAIPIADRPDLRVSAVRDYNPDTGSSWIYTYRSFYAQLVAIATYWEQLGSQNPIGYGYKTTTTITADGGTLVVRIPEGFLLLDRWGIDTEVEYMPFEWSEEIRAFLLDEAGTSYSAVDLGTVDGLTKWFTAIRRLRQGVNLVLAATDSTDASGNTITVGEQLTDIFPTFFNDATGEAAYATHVQTIMDIVRYGDTLERYRKILKRRRFLPANADVSTRVRANAAPIVYTTAYLILPASFAMPTDIATQISGIESNLPAAPAGTIWSWKLRQTNSEVVINAGKFEEITDWVFGLWSSIRNTVVTTP